MTFLHVVVVFIGVCPFLIASIASQGLYPVICEYTGTMLEKILGLISIPIAFSPVIKNSTSMI